MTKLHIDLETYSALDIKKVGAYKYFESPQFEILLFAWAFGDEPVTVTDLASGETLPPRVQKALTDPGVLKCAHNAAFERGALRAAGIATVPIEQWHCTMVQALYCGLPLALGQVSQALHLDRTNKAKAHTGRALIRYFCGPCRPTKTNGQRTRNLPDHDPERWDEFIAYCRQDVEAEREVDRLLEKYPLPKTEKEAYILDQQINDRGIQIDRHFASQAIKIDLENSEAVLSQLSELTGVDNPNSPAQLKEWLTAAMGRQINSLAKDQIDSLLEEAEPGAVSEVLKLRKKAAKTSVRKYARMLACRGEGDRVRGLFQFYGANRTGRWAGRLVQMQNLPRSGPATDLHTAREAIKTGDWDLTRILYDDPAGVLSQLIRSAFIAPEGHLFAVADFSAIEARVTAWYAEEEWRLDVFRTHGKIYEASAAMMFGIPIEEITRDSPERFKGKVAELALGFGGALGAMRKLGGEDMGLSQAEMEEIVRRWRAKNSNICKFWRQLDEAAKRVVRTGKNIAYRGLVFSYDGTALQIRLPSGRKLFYWKPSFTTNRFGGESLQYYNLDQTTRKWQNTETYGGKLCENIVQATARDLLSWSMLALDQAGYKIVMHVHDEVVCEVPAPDPATAWRELSDICQIMSQPQKWAPGLPLGAEGFTTPFYKKD